MADSDKDVIREDEAESKAASVVQQALREYAQARIASYQQLTLERLLTKDVLMFAMRGVETSRDFIDSAFAAFESSSEETRMGTTWQQIFNGLATKAVDLSDLLVEKDDDLWVVEVKSQINTTTGRFKPSLYRELRDRVLQYSRAQRSRRGKVRAMIGVTRGPATDREIVCDYPPRSPYADLNGFTIRYMVGPPFLRWLIGRPSILSLVGDVSDAARSVRDARSECLERLHEEMEQLLAQRGDDRSMQAVLDLIESRA